MADLAVHPKSAPESQSRLRRGKVRLRCRTRPRSFRGEDAPLMRAASRIRPARRTPKLHRARHQVTMDAEFNRKRSISHHPFSLRASGSPLHEAIRHRHMRTGAKAPARTTHVPGRSAELNAGARRRRSSAYWMHGSAACFLMIKAGPDGHPDAAGYPPPLCRRVPLPRRMCGRARSSCGIPSIPLRVARRQQAASSHISEFCGR